MSEELNIIHDYNEETKEWGAIGAGYVANSDGSNKYTPDDIKKIDNDLKTHKADYISHPLLVDYTLSTENILGLSGIKVITLNVPTSFDLKDGTSLMFKTKENISSRHFVLISIPGYTWKISEDETNGKGTMLAHADNTPVMYLRKDNIYIIRLYMTIGTTNTGIFVLENGENEGSISTKDYSLKNITNSHNKQINVSSESTVSGDYSQINASYNSTVSGDRSQINASLSSHASGNRCQVNSSESSTASGTKSQIHSSYKCEVDSIYYTGYGGNVIISGNCIKLDDSCGYGIVAGGSAAIPSAPPSTQNRKWQLDGDGNIKASGAITGNSSFADFAEYFESIDGESIPLGTIVSLAEGGKIKVAQEGDHMIGVISQTAGIILNAQGFEWKDRYLYDRYGQPILVDKKIEDESKIYEMYNSYLKTTEQQEEQKEHISLEEYKATLPDIPMTTIKAPMLNPNWDNKQEYIPREDRKEWNVVGLTGQIYTNIDNTVQEGDFVKVGQNGIATKGRNEYGQNWQVMKITTPYQEDLGFGIAIVFVR